MKYRYLISVAIEMEGHAGAEAYILDFEKKPSAKEILKKIYKKEADEVVIDDTYGTTTYFNFKFSHYNCVMEHMQISIGQQAAIDAYTGW